jgi:hypothetical protein
VVELLSTVGLWIRHSISEIEKDEEDNLYNPDSCKTIHVANFGKFVPNVPKMKAVKRLKANVVKKNRSIQHGEELLGNIPRNESSSSVH